MARTSGGLIKRSMTFEEKQLREMESIAADMTTSTAAVMRDLLRRGLADLRRDQQILRQHSEPDLN